MLEIELENSFKDALSKGINLFLGAGFSVLAKDVKGQILPTANHLKKELINEFNRPELKNLPLDKIATILKKTELDDFNSFMKNRFTVGDYDRAYNSLNKVACLSIFTTNIDNLVANVFRNNEWSYINNVTKTGASFAEKTAINFIPLHGDVDDEFPEYYFSTTEIAAAFSSDPDKWRYLTHALTKAPTLFWGYSLEDAGVLEAMSPLATKGRAKETIWIAVKDADDASIEYFQALGLNIIKADTISLLKYIESQELGKNKGLGGGLDTSGLFPEYSIPAASDLPSRSLAKFFMGEPPLWSDIYSNRIHRTKYYSKIANEIAGGKNIIVTGTPASGKTTVLMQLALGVNFEGHKLVCQEVTKEKADLLIRRLGDDAALILFDNFSTDLQAFNMLSKSTNVVLVGFERDYNYEIVSHKIDDKYVRRIDITVLEALDTQEILNRMPDQIKSAGPTETQDEASPTIYEIIQLNTRLPKLKDRFRDVINELESAKPILLDILIMMSYVYSCRTLVSFDMLMAFLRNTTQNYEEVYRLVEELGNMVTDYGGSTFYVPDNQDYFTTRSTIIAEAIIGQTPSTILKRVITRFLEEVSPFRIYRYDIFKRKAYDAGLIRRAFPLWEEGYDFYNKVYDLDHSPYVRQQGALYLAKMNRYREAFAWIDEAILRTNNKVFSIKNSNAIILFKANIDKDSSDGTVRETLDQSMRILSDCYNSDQRKLYHSLVFSDQSLKYYEKYPDSTARDYLETAKKWLTEESKKGYRKRDIARLLRKLDKTIQLSR